MADHSGNISSNETWLLADSPHHLTGNVTVNAGITLTIQAGCQIYSDGNYKLTIAGGLISNGTSSSRIVYRSNLTTAIYDSWWGFDIANCNVASSITYTDISNVANGIYIEGTLSSAVTIDHIHMYNCRYRNIANVNTSSVAITISNSKFIDFSIMISPPSTTQTFNNCYFEKAVTFVTSNNTTLTFNNCLFFNMACSNAGTGSSVFTNCVFNAQPSYSQFQQTTNLTNCIVTGCRDSYGLLYSASDGTLTNCDIFSMRLHAVTNGGGLVDCYLAGCNTASPLNVDQTADSGSDDGVMNTQSTNTPAMFQNVDYVSGLKATPNFGFTISGITETPSDTTCIIAFTSERAGKTIVRYGKVSGTYDCEYDGKQNWSGYDGSGAYGTSHSATLSGLSRGTTYYYKCYSLDALGEYSESSEGNFTTTGSASADFITPISVALTEEIGEIGVAVEVE